MMPPERACPVSPAVRFLLGPAGSGKTWRCLGEIRAELQQSPEGPPLVLLVPKQATFQLERQLLTAGGLSGYTRLQILSFERLADRVLDGLAPGRREFLDEEGRLMVLRALLARWQGGLKVFRATARMPGFGQHLSLALRELQCGRVSPGLLEELAQLGELGLPLRDKLHDLALLFRAYLDWLEEEKLEDAHQRLDSAAAALRDLSAHGARHSGFQIDGLWLDGFAEMTLQEISLLAALAPRCRQATLAFCLDTEPHEEPSWLSTWSVVSQTFRRLHARLASSLNGGVTVEVLRRTPGRGRFAGAEVLADLERRWAAPAVSAELETARAEAPIASSAVAVPAPSEVNPAKPVRWVFCSSPEAEAVFAAREIHRYVREEGGRFRDAAVLLRNLDGYHDSLRRVFQRYAIPFFLDRRESVAHHPLAELTRSALRTVALGWQAEDWFGALRTGLLPAADEEIDALENAALACGWRGNRWHRSLEFPENPAAARQLEQLRLRLIAPFQRLARTLTRSGRSPTGTELAQALSGLWHDLRVADRVADWTELASSSLRFPASPSPHATVWGRMESWLDNLDRGFRTIPLPLHDWLPIVETGLAGLTIGVVPPALDQVLIGTIDRSRNPDLKIAFVLGLNESVFPASPPPAVLLTEADCADLEKAGVALGPSARQRLGHERYYGYVACTRAAERLTLTCSTHDSKGRPLNPSLFLAHLRQLFPRLPVESFAPGEGRASAEHPCELLSQVIEFRLAALPERLSGPLFSWPGFAPAIARAERVIHARRLTRLDPTLAEALYGRELRTSVTGLEEYAACPFRFFALRGLRAEERREFEVDPRECGSFQHEVLQAFHREVADAGRRWRDLTSDEAQARIREIGERRVPIFRNGLFAHSAASRLNVGFLIEALQRQIAVLVEWMPQYGFDPAVVEVGFGLNDSGLPSWELDLGEGHQLVLRGRIDRVDLCHGDRPGEALAVVIDYKSGERRLDAAQLHHGLELQLLAYLNALTQTGNGRPEFGGRTLLPAGAFYVSLRGPVVSAGGRDEAQARADATRKAGYRHTGRFRADVLSRFDSRGAEAGDQFKYRKKKDGGFVERGNEAVPADAFTALLRRNEGFLRQHGQAILAGEVRVAPYRQGQETACDLCPCLSICRFDPWVQGYRSLTPPPRSEPAAGPEPAAGGRREP
jgi:ATP-dependent helicase/nuclease subunit B